MPQGDKRGSGWEFYDATYDGFWEGDLLRNGLGQLTDGRVGPENFKMAYYEYERGKCSYLCISFSIFFILIVQWILLCNSCYKFGHFEKKCKCGHCGNNCQQVYNSLVIIK